jgi:hypothetical protein
MIPVNRVKFKPFLASGGQGGSFRQRWQVQVTGAGEEMENILRNKTTSNRVGAPHPRPPGPVKHLQKLLLSYNLNQLVDR